MAWGRAQERCRWQGETFNYRTKAAAMEIERRVGKPMNVYQGSYNSDVDASGGTHSGGGAIDFMIEGEPHEIENKARRIGWALWHRPRAYKADGSLLWGEHYHGILLGDKELSDSAKWQIDEYMNEPGGDGLTGSTPDDNQFHPVVIFNYRRWLRKRTLARRIRETERAISRLSRKHRALKKEYKATAITDKH